MLLNRTRCTRGEQVVSSMQECDLDAVLILTIHTCTLVLISDHMSMFTFAL